MIYIDEGTKRSPTDYFRFSGVHDNTTSAAAATQMLWRYRTQQFASAQQVTNTQLWEVWVAEPGLVNSLQPGARISRAFRRALPAGLKPVLAPSVAALAHYLTFRTAVGENAALGAQFIEGLETGLGLGSGRVRGAGDPRNVLRRALLLSHSGQALDLNLDSARLGSQYRARTVLSAWSYALDSYLAATPIRNSVDNPWGGYVGPELPLFPFNEEADLPDWVSIEADEADDDEE
jgi:hypothetical protein